MNVCWEAINKRMDNVGNSNRFSFLKEKDRHIFLPECGKNKNYKPNEYAILFKQTTSFKKKM